MDEDYRGFIDDPSAGQDVRGLIRIAGWALSPAGPNVAAEVEVEGMPASTLVVGRSRPDVAAIFAEPWAMNCGVAGALDLAGLPSASAPRPVGLIVRVIDSDGNRRELHQAAFLGPPRPTRRVSHRPIDVSLSAWLNTPLGPDASVPRFTLGAFQTAVALGYLGSGDEMAARLPELADRLQRDWQEFGDDVVPESILRAIWVPADRTGLLGLPIEWRDSYWGERLLLWLNDDSVEAAPDDPPLTWFAVFAHSIFEEVRRRFPDPLRRDRSAFVHWLADEAEKQLGAPSCMLESARRFVRAHHDGNFGAKRHGGQFSFRRWNRSIPSLSEIDEIVRRSPAWPAPEAFPLLRARWRRPVASAGVNVVGHFAADTGHAEATRSTLRSLRAGGWATRTVDLGLREHSGGHVVREGSDAGGWFDVTVTHDHFVSAQHTLAALGRRFVLERYNIGFWYWELAELPASLVPMLGCVDELWVASEFTADAIRTHTDKPVSVVPLAIDVDFTDGATSRARFGLPSERFLFLTQASAGSVFGRKNPAGAVEAFVKAFSSSDLGEVGLVVKTRGLRHAPELRTYLESAASTHPIYIIDESLDRASALGLLSCTDAFVSLHRGEGFGLPIAEAMALGKPTVVTEYSGSADFATPSTALTVGYSLIPVGSGHDPFPAELAWADPDLDDAAAKLRLVWADRSVRERVARAGRQEIRRRYSPRSASAVIRERLERIGCVGPEVTCGP